MHRTLRSAAALLLLLIVLSSIAACSRDIPDAPDDFYVLDEAGVLSRSTKNHILEQNDALSAACGAQVVVVCVKNTGRLGIADYTTRILNEWGVGSAEKNNGVVLVLSIEADDYWMQQGKGLESLLPSGTLKLLLEDYLEPDFARKEYNAGVRAVFDALTAELCRVYSVSLSGAPGDLTPAPAGAEKSSGALSVVIWILIILILVFLIAAWMNSSHTVHRRVRRVAPRRTSAASVYTGRIHPTTSGRYGGYTDGYGGSYTPNRAARSGVRPARPGGGVSGRGGAGRTSGSGFSGRTGGGGASRGGGAGRR